MECLVYCVHTTYSNGLFWFCVIFHVGFDVPCVTAPVGVCPVFLAERVHGWVRSDSPVAGSMSEYHVKDQGSVVSHRSCAWRCAPRVTGRQIVPEGRQRFSRAVIGGAPSHH